MMVGHKVTLNIARPEPVNPKPRLKVEGLSVKDEDGIYRLKNVSFEARSEKSSESPVFPAADRRSFWSRLPDFR